MEDVQFKKEQDFNMLNIQFFPYYYIYIDCSVIESSLLLMKTIRFI